MYQVGSEDLMKKMKKKIGVRYSAEEIATYKASMAGWSLKDRLWKEFVGVCRHFNVFPPEQKVYCGLLHQCDSTLKTEEGAEPVADHERWVQFCVRGCTGSLTGAFGKKKLFFEFIIDWEDWYSYKQPEANKNDEKKEKDAVDANVTEIWYNEHPNPHE